MGMSAPNTANEAAAARDAAPGAAGRASLEPLERPRPGLLPPRVGRWVMWLAWAGLLGVALSDRAQEIRCVDAAPTMPTGLATIICQREYVKTGAPSTGVRLAALLEDSDQDAAAKALATNLLSTPVRADAFRVLGYLAYKADRFDEAVSSFEAARALHRDANRNRELALDDQALAQLLFEHNRYKDALIDIDECIASISTTHVEKDKPTELYCHLAAANILQEVGDYDLAQNEIDRAGAVATGRDLEQIPYAQGNLDQKFDNEIGREPRNQEAIVEFEKARTLNEHSQFAGHAVSIELNLSYSLAEVGRTAEAASHLATARTLDVDHTHEIPLRALAARIAYRSGHFAEAAKLNDDVYKMADADTHGSDDDSRDIAAMQTRIALIQNDLALAEQWAKRGIAHVERVRRAQDAIALRPVVLASRREPYELLFITLARVGRNEDAVLLLGDWLGRTLRDSIISPAMSVDLLNAARRLDTVGAWMPTVDAAGFAEHVDRTAAIDTLRKIDLLALVVADATVWRVVASHGRIHIDSLGALSALRDLADALSVAPNDKALGNKLGTMILPDDVFRDTPEALHVLLDGPVAALPVAALRHQGRPLIVARPMVRVATLPEIECVPPAGSGRATVLADTTGALPDAVREAAVVAGLIHATPLIGSAATSKALFETAENSVLHIAAHAYDNAGGGMLKLADRDVSAMEIAARKLGPPLVVVLTCSSARSSERDVELAGSLATAFLAAGSNQVVATLRPIVDKTTPDLVEPFYHSGGVNDPVRALAAAQARLADTNNVDWPSFAVFGHDTCRPASAAH